MKENVKPTKTYLNRLSGSQKNLLFEANITAQK